MGIMAVLRDVAAVTALSRRARVRFIMLAGIRDSRAPIAVL